MANPEHLAMLRRGREKWNNWRRDTTTAPDLSGADLCSQDLTGFYLHNADFSVADLRHARLGHAILTSAIFSDAVFAGANLEFAHLFEANFSGADLSGVEMWGADLSRASLRGANLRRTHLESSNLDTTNPDEADMSGAELQSAQFRGSKLRNTRFNRAQLQHTIFANVDLSMASGLEDVLHLAPSSVGIDSIYASHGKIPEAFLRGCGVPDEFIAYIGSMVGRPIEFYSCFISYSTKDQEFAERLYNDLQGNGVRCWFAPHDIQGGRKLHEQLDEAIRLHDKLLLILSEHSMNSPWVKTEMLRAQKREIEENKSPTLSSKDDDKDGAPTRKKKQILFPITLSPYAALENWEYPTSTGIDLAEEIRQYFIPDFSNWKDHDSYQKAFQRLVKDLKAEARSAAG